ncbi:hypothetical protein [Chryseobacterium pennipullorum]|nr:hypothetical protein [Chryseobacterium pennipullorum]
MKRGLLETYLKITDQVQKLWRDDFFSYYTFALKQKYTKVQDWNHPLKIDLAS